MIKKSKQNNHTNNPHKKNLITIIILIITILLIYYVENQNSYSNTNNKNNSTTINKNANLNLVIEENITYSVWFCPRDNCRNIFETAINNTQESIYCAIYEMDPTLKIDFDKLTKKNITVGIVFEADNTEKQFASNYTRFDKNSAYMHNKFCVIDNNLIITGSTNPTINDFEYNNNNLVAIRSPTLAKRYTEEYLKISEGMHGLNKNTGENGIKIIYNYGKNSNNSIYVENYFCPQENCAQHLIEKIRSANKTINFATFSFTDKQVVNELIFAIKRNVSVTGVFEKRMGNETKLLLEYQEANVRFDQNSKTMHHKFFIFDDEMVWTGSYNPTGNGNTKNDENVIVIKDKTIAQKYLEEMKEI
jgi:phosphatidylserine/phosphatidylglycerophosphate/cardiolipin synthase-like enzyme